MNAPPLTPIDPLLVSAIPGWFAPPRGRAELVARYGDIQVAGGRVTTPGWEDANMAVAFAPWMPKGRLYVNAQVKAVLLDAFEACIALGDGYRIVSLACFAPRPKRVNGDLSTHSWGIAVDLNPDANPLSMDGVLRYDIPAAWIAEFERRGWVWGGRWQKPDAMHLQFAVGY